MCNADVKTNKGSSGFPTTFIQFKPTTGFCFVFPTTATQLTIDARCLMQK